MTAPTDPSTGSVTTRPWGHAPDGTPLHLYDLAFPGGIHVRVTNYGGVVTHLLAPDGEGRTADVVLGHDRPEPYFDRATSPYFGALIGRYGNRVRAGRFSLDGQGVQLAVNNGPNALHGGPTGFDQQVWTARASVEADGPTLELGLVSPDGHEGYPGTLDVRVRYTVTPPTPDTFGALRIDYHATTDAPTVVNLTNHSYFNLSGGDRDVLDHELRIDADAITEVDDTLIPTGAFQPVPGTPFDFRTPRRVGERIAEDHDQLRYAGGYDHNFVLNGSGLRVVAEVHDPHSGRRMTVRTTEPGVQVYSGNFLDGQIVGKDGQAYGRNWSLCLETQHFPDSPNQPHFPSTVLRPGQTYTSRTEYVFSAGSARPQ